MPAAGQPQAAERAGARVIVRTNDRFRGKGYALAEVFGLLLPVGFDACAVSDAHTENASKFITDATKGNNASAKTVQARNRVTDQQGAQRTRNSIAAGRA